MNWLEIEDIIPDDPRYVPIERIQEEEMERLIGWELNLWLMWRENETHKSS